MIDRAGSADLGKEVADFQWLLAEIDRMWFHDNALSFQVGDWIRSSWSWDRCSPDFLARKRKRSSSRCPSPLEIQSQRRVEMEEVNRSLRETGKVFSTGDLPGFKAAAAAAAAADESVHGGIADDEERSISPGCVSDGGIGMAVLDEEDDFLSRKLETIPSASALFVADKPIIQEVKVSSIAAAAAPATAAASSASRRRRRSSSHHRSKSNRSWSELEFDELRGLRDLGFKPSKEDLLTPRRVVSLGVASASTSPAAAAAATRIYPSHAWSIRRPDSPLLNLRLPDPNRQGVEDMKAHLKFWARAVASTVRQEC